VDEPKSHWWTKSEKARTNALKVLRQINRAITPALVNSSLPPLPPKLWRKMRRKFPHLYKDERKEYVLLKGLPKREWREFVKACKTWKVSTSEALIAFLVLFPKLVAQTGDPEDG
jgi:hypothetical protein